VFFNQHPPRGDPSGLDAYSMFLVAGLLPWTFLSNGLSGATGSIVANESLVKKVYFPRLVLPAASVAAWFSSFGVEMIVFAVVLLLVGNMAVPWLPLVLVLMVIQATFVLGIGLALSAANAYFRDVQHFLAIFLNVWFYATPIIYPSDLIPESREVLGITVAFRDLLSMNPMTKFVAAYRSLLYDLRSPALAQWLTLAVGSLLVLVVGMWVFSRVEPRLAEEL